MTTDAFTTAARAEAEGRFPAPEPDDVLTYPRSALREHKESAFRAGAEWARDHLARQEPTEAEVEAATGEWQAHSHIAHPVEDQEPSCAECGYAFGWRGIDPSEETKRYREHATRSALSAASKARIEGQS